MSLHSWEDERAAAIAYFQETEGMTLREATNAVEGFPLAYGSGVELSPAELAKVIVFDLDHRLSLRDHVEGMRFGFLILGIMSAVLLGFGLLVVWAAVWSRP